MTSCQKSLALIWSRERDEERGPELMPGDVDSVVVVMIATEAECDEQWSQVSPTGRAAFSSPLVVIVGR